MSPFSAKAILFFWLDPYSCVIEKSEAPNDCVIVLLLTSPTRDINIFELRDKSPTIFAFPVKSTSFKMVCFDVDGFSSIENLPKNSDDKFGAVFCGVIYM